MFDSIGSINNQLAVLRQNANNKNALIKFSKKVDGKVKIGNVITLSLINDREGYLNNFTKRGQLVKRISKSVEALLNDGFVAEIELFDN